MFEHGKLLLQDSR